jgi:hypothetical protein
MRQSDQLVGDMDKQLELQMLSEHKTAVGLLARSQRYSTIEEEEACRLWPEKKWLVQKVKDCVAVVPKKEIMSLGFYLKVIH